MTLILVCMNVNYDFAFNNSDFKIQNSDFVLGFNFFSFMAELGLRSFVLVEL